MVTTMQVILYKNALLQPPFSQTKYTYEQLKKTLQSVSIITRHFLTARKMQMTPPYVWEVNDKSKETLSLRESFVKSIGPRYSSVTKKYLLCLHEKTEVINYPNQQEELLRNYKPTKICHLLNTYWKHEI